MPRGSDAAWRCGSQSLSSQSLSSQSLSSLSHMPAGPLAGYAAKCPLCRVTLRPRSATALSPSTSTASSGHVNTTLDFWRVSHVASMIETCMTLCQRPIAQGTQFVHLRPCSVQMSDMITGMSIVMSGLPGAGKSAIADAIAGTLPAAVISVDPIEAAMRRSGVGADQPTGLAAYVIADALARHMIRLDQSV